MAFGTLPAGRALPIAAAHLQIAGQTLSSKTGAGDKAATFVARLKGGGKTQMQAWFSDAEGKDICGAYYAYVRHGRSLPESWNKK
jgi:hypothetical protein